MKKLRILALILAVALIFGGCGARTEAFDSKNEAFDAGGWTEEMKPVEPEAPMEMPEMEYVTEDSAFDNSTSASISDGSAKDRPVCPCCRPKAAFLPGPALPQDR